MIKYGVFLIFLMGTTMAFAQLSPGELTKAHAHLEGLKNCTKCHVLGEKETTSKCLECHTEIRDLMAQNRGYHASTDVKVKNCADCHGEHFGRDFEIVRFETGNFDHALTGYALHGKHAELQCAGCHKPELIKNRVSQKKSGQTYLGLETECLSCHADYHRGTLAGNCTSCHDQRAFSPATGFDHAKTGFPLLGKHISVDCDKCHEITVTNGIRFQKFAGIEHDNCTACHEDVHHNKFGNDCTKCHNQSSFSQIAGLSEFDHERTGFPLRGLHRAVACKACHKENLTRTLKHDRCTDCHTDYHNGEFVENGVGPDCSDCHSEKGFSPSAFTIERHAKTRFPLDGAHLATPCVVCHKQGNRWSFIDRGTRCVDCHENIHQNHIAEKFYTENGCRNCHSSSSWEDIGFDHNQTGFALEGRHSEISCRSCHFDRQNGITVQRFANLPATCESCHQDIHYRQFEVDNVTDCARCHTPRNWSAEKFDHNSARFKLDGEHVKLECVQCHKPTVGLNKNYIRYKFEDISCASCH